MDLPDEEERAAIWRIHLGKVCQGSEFSDADIAELASASAGYSGAEIEQIVQDSLYEAYQPEESLILTVEGIRTAMAECVPLSKAREDDLKRINAWAEKNARHASRARPKQAAKNPHGRAKSVRENSVDLGQGTRLML